MVDKTGTRTFAYTSNQQLSTETLPSGYYGSRVVARAYHDGTYAPIGVLSATALGASGNPWVGGGGAINQAGYGYVASTGRLNNVERSYDGASAHSFTYAYESNGNRITSVTSGYYQLAFDLDGWRPVPDRVRTYWNSGTKADYQSTYDDLARRTRETGATVPVTGVTTPVEQNWGYNARSEITSETIKHNGTTISAEGRTYAFDNGWNRTSTVVGTSGTTTYNFGIGATANRISSTSGYEAGSFAYDEDGNLTADDLWNYSYDAENRVIGMTLKSSTGDPNDCERLDFEYDYLGRRVRKTTYKSTAGTGLILDVKFVYDGWNLWAELDATNSNAVLRTYTWGRDAGGMIGGSGTGGLLLISSGSDRWYPAYDARHNVTGLLDGSGNWVAAYSYDSFGRITRQQGGSASTNPFGFSTQYTDRETGLSYYGRRFYSPKLGRFINRDPIEEQGGLNLYAFVNNSPANAWDVLGCATMQDVWADMPDEALMLSVHPNRRKIDATSWYDPEKDILFNYRGERGGHEQYLHEEGLDLGWGSFGASIMASDQERDAEWYRHLDSYNNGFIDYMDKVQQALDYLDTHTDAELRKDYALAMVNDGKTVVVRNSKGELQVVRRGPGPRAPNSGGALAAAASGATAASGTGGSVLGNLVSGALDLVGKVWNLPNTAIGLVVGGVGHVAGLVMGTDPGISIGNNGIQFTNNPLAFAGAITLGNAIVYGPGFGPDFQLPNGTVGDHERQHTYQGQLLGPLYLPSNILGIGAGLLFNGDAHGPANWNEVGPQANPPRPWGGG